MSLSPSTSGVATMPQIGSLVSNSSTNCFFQTTDPSATFRQNMCPMVPMV